MHTLRQVQYARMDRPPPISLNSPVEFDSSLSSQSPGARFSDETSCNVLLPPSVLCNMSFFEQLHTVVAPYFGFETTTLTTSISIERAHTAYRIMSWLCFNNTPCYWTLNLNGSATDQRLGRLLATAVAQYPSMDVTSSNLNIDKSTSDGIIH